MFLHDTMPRPVKILLVEDSGVQTVMTKAALAELPQLDLLYVAADGVEATEFLRRRVQADAQLPDVVLLDLNMPRRNGFEVLAELKSAPVLRRIPIVVFSTSEAQEDIDRAYEEGANTYILKPARLEDLKQTLENFAVYWAETARLPTHFSKSRSARSRLRHAS